MVLTFFAQRYATVQGFVKSVAAGISARSKRVLSFSQALDFVVRVIHEGPITGSNAFDTLNPMERQSFIDLLHISERCCYWTGVVLVFKQFSGFRQFSPDRIGLQSLSYSENGQSTAAGCLWSQRYVCPNTQFVEYKLFLILYRLFNDMNPNRRKNFIHLLISKYNPARADIFMTNYDNIVDNGVFFGDDARKYWEKKWESQSQKGVNATSNLDLGVVL